MIEEARLLLHTRDSIGTRRVAEPRLQEFTKQWRFGSVTTHAVADGTVPVQVIEYIVQLKRKVTPDELVAVMRSACSPQVLDVELV